MDSSISEAVNDPQVPHFIYWIVGCLVTAIGVMWIAYVKLQKTVITIIVDNTKSNEHLARSIDNLPERITDKLIVNGLKVKSR